MRRSFYMEKISVILVDDNKAQLNELAKDIEDLEKEKAELTAKMQEQLDYQELDALGKRMNEITDLIDEKELRWLELDEIENC